MQKERKRRPAWGKIALAVVVLAALAAAWRWTPLAHFMLGTFFALLPGLIAWTVFGEQVTAALEQASASYGVMAAVVVLLALFVFATRWWLRKKGF